MFVDKIKQLREQNNLLQRQISAALEMATGQYSKLQIGDRRAKIKHTVKIEDILNTDNKELLKLLLADQLSPIVEIEKDIAAKEIKFVNTNLINNL